MHLKLLEKEQFRKQQKQPVNWLVIKSLIKVSRISTQNNSETITNETQNIKHDKEMPKERYISPEERQKIIDDLTLINIII